ncbi:MAG: hypothetical protein AAFP85_12590 [Pseudomonadota bacterium]
MTMPEQAKNIPEDVRQMMARARPEQIKRLLDDIARLPVKEATRYDA